MNTTLPFILILVAVICVLDWDSAPAGELSVGTSLSLSPSGKSPDHENLTIASPSSGGEGEFSTAGARRSDQPVLGEQSPNETWQAALSDMPLGTNVTELNRTNCIPLLLNAFQSNKVVKALIFMPGATDELYYIRRAHATLPAANPTLANAILALTNQTYIQADFRPPFLLLHTTEDVLDPIAIVKSDSTAARLQAQIVPNRLVFNDCSWDDLRPALGRKLGVGLRPFSNAPDSWHFYHNNFAACGLTQWELLEAIALSGKTSFTLRHWTADFAEDNRNGPVPHLTNLPAP